MPPKLASPEEPTPPGTSSSLGKITVEINGRPIEELTRDELIQNLSQSLHENAFLSLEVRRLTHQLGQTTEDLASARTMISELGMKEATIQQLRKLNEDLAKENEAIRSKIASLEKTIVEQGATITKQGEDIEKLKQADEAKSKEIAQLRKDVFDGEMEINKLRLRDLLTFLDDSNLSTSLTLGTFRWMKQEVRLTNKTIAHEWYQYNITNTTGKLQVTRKDAERTLQDQLHPSSPHSKEILEVIKVLDTSNPDKMTGPSYFLP